MAWVYAASEQGVRSHWPASTIEKQYTIRAGGLRTIAVATFVWVPEKFSVQAKTLRMEMEQVHGEKWFFAQ